MSSSTRAALLLGLAALILASAPAAARTRIATGQDLYAACRVLADFILNPRGETPRAGLYCRQYIAGYFSAARHVRESGEARKALDLPLATGECTPVDGPQSWDQLARKIVHEAEWRPALLDKPAFELARAAFGDKPPC